MNIKFTSKLDRFSRTYKLTKGFTLVELLVVIAILALVAGIAGPQVIKQFSGAKTDTAGLQIKDLTASFDLFYLDLGRYPTTEEGLQALVTQPGDLDEWNGPYLRDNAVPKDPWGNDYIYKSPGTSSLFEIISLGADHAPGGEKDDADIINGNQ